MSTIGIVTVLYNSETVLRDFFLSLNSQTYKDFTLYVIDNASKDEGLKLAKELAQKASFRCVIIPEEENWGIAKGNNIGIKVALNDGCKYVLLSNNDVVLNHTNTIEILLKKIESLGADIICPKIYYHHDPNLIWAAGGDYKFFDTATVHFGSLEKDNGQFNKEQIIRYTPTCFTLIKNSVFDEIGLMDEDYFVYYDDTDFMYRAWKHHLKIIYTPETSILHNESVSTGKNSSFRICQLVRNQFYFVRKNRTLLTFIILLLYRLAVFTKHLFTHPASLNKDEFKAICEGISSPLYVTKK